MSCKFHKAIFHALLAAALYAVSIPFSKLLLTHLAPTMLAAFLYIGAGVGMAVMDAVKRGRSEEPLQRDDIKYTVAMVVLDILAPILLMLGLKYSPAASASLLNNFEIVATAVIALVLFGEAVGSHCADNAVEHTAHARYRRGLFVLVGVAVSARCNNMLGH